MKVACGAWSPLRWAVLCLSVCWSIPCLWAQQYGGERPQHHQTPAAPPLPPPSCSGQTQRPAPQHPTQQGDTPETCRDEFSCLSLETPDKAGLEAIWALHRQLDDDANGNIDLAESDEFLREELKYEAGYEKRQRVFHRNDDTHISVRELWDAWLKSEIHNWTVEQTVEWLTTTVELPQYIPNFIHNKVNGASLPRLAVSNMQYITSSLGIKDPIHKQKLALKAMDVVLFGPPKEYSNHVKDFILVTLLLVALAGCWYATQQNKRSKQDLKKMIKDMESLSKAEQALFDTQKELEKAKVEQENVTSEKQTLEKLLHEQDIMARESDPHDAGEISKLRAEIEILRGELHRAEVELEDKCWVPPPALQHWLQLTHELELKSYNRKKSAAEKQLQQAREALRKKRSSLVGAFVSTHGKSIDDVDKSILEARAALTEVTQDLQERAHRWKQVEQLCGFPVTSNPGLPYLETLLRGMPNGRHSLGIASLLSASQDDLDDDTSSTYSPSAVQQLVSTSAMLFLTSNSVGGHHSGTTHTAPTSSCLVAHPPDYMARPYLQSRKMLPSRDGNSAESLGHGNSLHHSHTLAVLQNSEESTKAMPRSKSVSSMGSLKDRGRESRDSSHSDGKDSSNGEDDTDTCSPPLPLDAPARGSAHSAQDKKVSFGASGSSPSGSTSTTPSLSRRGNIVKSYSQETTASPRDIQEVLNHTKNQAGATPRVMSQSDSALPVQKMAEKVRESRGANATPPTVEEETSTDSNSVGEEDSKGKKKKKKTIFFHSFAKKNKAKVS